MVNIEIDSRDCHNCYVLCIKLLKHNSRAVSGPLVEKLMRLYWRSMYHDAETMQCNYLRFNPSLFAEETCLKAFRLPGEASMTVHCSG